MHWSVLVCIAFCILYICWRWRLKDVLHSCSWRSSIRRIIKGASGTSLLCILSNTQASLYDADAKGLTNLKTGKLWSFSIGQSLYENGSKRDTCTKATKGYNRDQSPSHRQIEHHAQDQEQFSPTLTSAPLVSLTLLCNKVAGRTLFTALLTK